MMKNTLGTQKLEVRKVEGTIKAFDLVMIHDKYIGISNTNELGSYPVDKNVRGHWLIYNGSVKDGSWYKNGEHQKTKIKLFLGEYDLQDSPDILSRLMKRIISGKVNIDTVFVFEGDGEKLTKVSYSKEV